MRELALCFLIGTVFCQQLKQLPDWHFVWLLILIIPLYFFLSSPVWRGVMAVSMGFLWAVSSAHYQLMNTPSVALENNSWLVEGYIRSFPKKQGRRVQFQFEIASIRQLDSSARLRAKISADQTLLKGERLLLSWYNSDIELQLGQVWRFPVRLKRLHALVNPGARDSRAWYYSQRLRYSGYVVTKKSWENWIEHRSQLSSPHRLDRIRAQIRQDLDKKSENAPLSPLVFALTVGDRSAITQQQWQVLSRTGTNHLMAISGLHIGLVAGIIYALFTWMWRRFGILTWIPAAKLAACFAIIGALLYAALAGFSLPTIRATIMVVCVMLAVLVQRNIRPSDSVSLALLLILLLDPFSVMFASFWLSFAAVVLILYLMHGRISTHGWYWKWGRIHVLLSIALLPFLLYWFQQWPLLSPLANFVAVPWVSILSVPCSLLAALLAIVDWDVIHIPLQIAHLSLELIWSILVWMSQLPFSVYNFPKPSIVLLTLAVLGVLLLLLPAGIPGRQLGWICIIPLWLFEPPQLAEDSLRFTLLDVGQGLAVVMQTRNHVMLFDTGAHYAGGYNAGRAVIAPYLHSLGVQQIDLIVVSHGDNDHKGGLQFVLDNFEVRSIISSETLSPASERNESCYRGQSWRWDGILFEIMHPDRNDYSRRLSDNNRSCVLRVTVGKHSILLTGDIEVEAEQLMLERIARNQIFSLSADILVVPHHGSRSSSSLAFIDAVHPRYALFAAGYRNRYNLPHEQVVQRYRDRGVQVFNSATAGALSFELSAAQGIQAPISYRRAAARYWHLHRDSALEKQIQH